MAATYITHNVLLKAADFHILILEFPDEDVNDKLTVLSHEKGLVYKHLYEDFAITCCMANSGPFFFHIRKRPELLTRFADIRKEALSLVYHYSPGFKPENIVINSNNILKTVASLKLEEESRPLTDNDLWHQDPPLSNFGPGVIISAPARSDDDDDAPFSGEGDENLPEVPSENPFAEPGDNPFADGSDGRDDVPYKLVGHKWDTLGAHINVRQYEPGEESLISLLGGTPFKTDGGYHLLVVQLCIEDFSDVFHLLDRMGVTKKFNPEQLTAELYEVAISYNSFLKREDLNLEFIRNEFKRRHKIVQRPNNKRLSAAGNEGARSRKRGIKFSDLTNEKLLKLYDDLKERVVGQDEALRFIADAVHRASVGLKRPNEPIGTLLFTGNTGVGKTETAKALAAVLGAHLVRIDCQEYQQSHEVAKLTGSPPGYVGYEDGGHLTREVAKYPFSVVLLDEIEKAHSNFHERILQIFDDGVLTESKGGNQVSFSECIILMTSNIGVKEVAAVEKRLGFGSSKVTEVKTANARKEALKQRFKPEFMNRIDEIVNFRLLDSGDYMHVLNILLAEVGDQLLKSKELKLHVNAGAKKFILDHGIDKKFGARPLRRAVKKHLSTPLAQAILKETIPTNKAKIIVSLKASKDALVFRPANTKTKKDVEQ